MAGLVITRRAGESVLIGDGIRVTVVEAGGRGHNVRLRIEAPEDVVITRSEHHRDVPRHPDPARHDALCACGNPADCGVGRDDGGRHDVA